MSKGSLEYRFNADGFGPPPACNPEREPAVDLENVVPVLDLDDPRATR